MSGPPPKPAHLRARTNKKPGAATLEAPLDPNIPVIPNPDGRVWHELTLKAWKCAWESPMASQWLDTDADTLGRLAILWDEYYKTPKPTLLAEIRLQEQRFGLSPLDRSRLQWEIGKGEEAERKQQRMQTLPASRGATDPRRVLMAVK